MIDMGMFAKKSKRCTFINNNFDETPDDATM